MAKKQLKNLNLGSVQDSVEQEQKINAEIGIPYMAPDVKHIAEPLSHEEQQRQDWDAIDRSNTDFMENEYMRFGFSPPFLVDRFPFFLKLDKFFEKAKFLNPLLPYFFIKGQKIKTTNIS